MNEEARYDPLSWIIIALIVAAVAVTLFATPAGAEEAVLAESTVGSGGLVCDTQAEVEAFITQTEAGTDPQEALNAIDGCGILIRPMRMRVVAIGTMKSENFNYLLVRYDFLDFPAPSQFGIGHRKSAGIPL
jgi:hypothetical protein